MFGELEEGTARLKGLGKGGGGGGGVELSLPTPHLDAIRYFDLVCWRERNESCIATNLMKLQMGFLPCLLCLLSTVYAWLPCWDEYQ